MTFIANTLLPPTPEATSNHHHTIRRDPLEAAGPYAASTFAFANGSPHVLKEKCGVEARV